jgi:rod shape-determining protein MreC
MESFFSRYRNPIVLAAVLLVQVIGLAVQVRKTVPVESGPTQARRDGQSVRLIRLWVAGVVTPFEGMIHGAGQGLNDAWNGYVDLRRVKEENRELEKTVDRLRLEQAELREDALQGQRLQALLKFRESYAYQTTAAQVIGTSGSTQSHVLYLDKGSAEGLAPDMAVISQDGIVGKVREVFPHTAQVLLINDQTSGAGVVLETTRIRGILRGNALGQPQVVNVLADQRIQKGERVLTAGGDQIFPRGLPVGQVEKVNPDPERGSFIEVIVKPAANLDHLDEVLVITSLQPQLSAQQQNDLATSEALKGAEVAADAERKKAAAEMAERLPGLKDPNAPEVPAVGPDGKPLAAPLAPVVPKPLPAVHPDRFSPGGAADAPVPDSGAVAPNADKPVESVPAAKGPGLKTKPAAPKPNTTKPPASKKGQAAGGAQ